MAIKVSLGKLTIPLPLDNFVTEQLLENNINLHPIQVRDTGLVATMPFHHRDPFDRMIIAQSLSDQLPIVGQDQTFDAYGVKRHW